jgi:hypothetical protein
VQLLRPGDFDEHLFTASIVVAGPWRGEWIPNLLRPISPLPLTVCLVDDASDSTWAQQKLLDAEAALVWLGQEADVSESLHSFLLQAVGACDLWFGAGPRWQKYRDELSEKSYRTLREGVSARFDEVSAMGFGFAFSFWQTPRCFACGCTDGNACDGGCSWVGDNLCSACLAKMVERGEDPDA